MKVLCPLVSSPVVTNESKGNFKQGRIYYLTFPQVRGGEWTSRLSSLWGLYERICLLAITSGTFAMTLANPL